MASAQNDFTRRSKSRQSADWNANARSATRFHGTEHTVSCDQTGVYPGDWWLGRAGNVEQFVSAPRRMDAYVPAAEAHETAVKSKHKRILMNKMKEFISVRQSPFFF